MDSKNIQNPWLTRRNRTGREYDSPYEAREKAGFDIHGEANCVEELLNSEFNTKPYRVLDAGCGTGRISIELARRGMEVIGVDLDEVMLERAKEKAPHMDWRLGDLSIIELGISFDAILLAGNVMIYLTPGTEAKVVENLTHQLKPGGLLVAGFELTPQSWTNLTLESYDKLTQKNGLSRKYLWSTWQKESWNTGDGYAVSVYKK